MYYQKIHVFIALIFSLALFQSCADDFSEFSSQDLQNSQNQRPGDGNGNNGNDNNSDVDIAIDWMDLFLELERYAGGMRPNASARAIAYINLAAYETALPSARGYNSNATVLDGLEIERNTNERRFNVEQALNRTYAIVIDHFLLNLPSEQRAKISELEGSLTQGRGNDSSEESIEWAEYVSQQVISYSQTDLQAESQILDAQPSSYIPPTGPGHWTFSAEPERALFPYWGEVRTFIVDPARTTTIPPMEYSTDVNSEYYAEMQEVYVSNNSAKNNQDEALWIAEFWSDDVENITFSPPSRQVSIANQLIQEERTDLMEALHLNLKLGFALNDAAVSTWKYKYEHMVMRPSVYIQDHIDANYQTNLYRLIPWPNPTFPSYPSGHSTFASAAGGVFIDFYGDVINFTDRSHEGRTEFQSAPRTFTSFTEMAEENGYSRIPLGVHMRIDCTEGIRLGYEVADGVNEYELRIPRG